MRQKKLQYLTIQQFTFLAYLALTTLMFFLAMSQGNEGVTFRLFGGGDDGYFYWIQAQNVAAGNAWIRTSIYPLIIGTLMKVTGVESVYLIRLFNYIGFLLLVTFSLKIIRIQFKIDDNKIGQEYKYKAQTLLLVSYLLYASLQMNLNFSILRDIWIYTVYILSTYLSIKLIFHKKNRFFYFVVLAVSIWLLGEFRGYAMLSFLLSLGIHFAYTKVKLLKKPKWLAFIGVGAFAMYYSFFMDLTVSGMSLRRALNYREAALDFHSGGSQMWISLDQSNFIFFLINYVHSYIGNLIGPLPWHISGVSTLFIFLVETIPMILILRFLWKKRNLLTKVQRYILLHGFVWVSLIGFTNDNLGTASRLRPVAWILILIVFVVVYAKNRYLKDSTRKQVVVK
ncbi:hypothetical protein GCM10012290_23890 [Halolactibacillus alkaliphilus]|uniref:Glycosyltransferase RgtA/B/C/D-like domain-containing protein n=1 Tax=Halolactibacillus alkaliphilus TaxID=442899 RepID=A0A511X4I2_9BACI|nr:hypothetical protein [Halolactibacillus alkaliphilus]GEN57841.1 hypothetical protein HAL01_23050 [Halolactibacillus alkaliphilus]GGN75214.1 hypothetical protein GCM10012290_23890 [Halolactibacillus alkaliphilus]SFP06311.1 hypothetical protein SAMN05720591_14014 [Halolactibacillus alkaliphilus]